MPLALIESALSPHSEKSLLHELGRLEDMVNVGAFKIAGLLNYIFPRLLQTLAPGVQARYLGAYKL